jgi:hypothetical protein
MCNTYYNSLLKSPILYWASWQKTRHLDENHLLLVKIFRYLQRLIHEFWIHTLILMAICNSTITINKSSCNHNFPSKTYFISTSLSVSLKQILRRIKMANRILVISTFIAISFSMVASFEPSPLQDFCVADPTSSGQDCTDIHRIILQ